MGALDSAGMVGLGGPVLHLGAALGGGVVVALLQTPLHRALAYRRREALLVDRVVTDRLARLAGAERRRALLHFHRAAGMPVARVAGLAALAAVLTLAAVAVVAGWIGPDLAADRRAGTRAVLAALDDGGITPPSLTGALTVSGVVLAALLALWTASLHVGALDLERRRAMPVTRPWPVRRGRASLLLAAVTFLVLLGAGMDAGFGLAAGLFLLGHQLVVRARRPGLCRSAPVVPEALRAARLPVTRERRLLRARSRAPEPVAAAPQGQGPPSSPLPPRPAPPRSPAPGSVGMRGPVAPVPHGSVPHTRLIDMAPAELPLNPHDPRTVAEYQLTGRLGSGGMGTVYLGRRPGTTASVAIKVLAPHLLDDVDARTRFLREGQTLQKVTGDYTARVLGVGFDGSMPYIVMERLDGPSLHAFVADSGSVSDGEMLTRTAIALARALAALHADGITHRDLKPGNILLTSAGPKVVDFGIARVVGQTHHTPAGTMVGTPGYMAPEQVTGNGAGPASDVWAWACCVVFAARGDHLFDGENIVDIARQILDGPPSDAFAGVNRLAPRLVPVLRRATAQEAGDRPRDGAALLRLLDRSGATATVGGDAWDRLVVGGVR